MPTTPTPGPWYVAAGGDAGYGYVIRSSAVAEPEYVAHTYPRRDSIADARLIAAAPALLDALRALYDTTLIPPMDSAALADQSAALARALDAMRQSGITDAAGAAQAGAGRAIGEGAATTLHADSEIAPEARYDAR